MLNILFLIAATTAAIIFFALAKSKKNEEEYEFFIVYTLIGIFCVLIALVSIIQLVGYIASMPGGIIACLIAAALLVKDN